MTFTVFVPIKTRQWTNPLVDSYASITYEEISTGNVVKTLLKFAAVRWGAHRSRALPHNDSEY